MASNRPTSAELLTAVSEFLEGEAMEAIDTDDVRFKLKIALNVLQLIRREVELGRDHEIAEVDGLQALLATDETSPALLNEELCRRIRNGDYDAAAPARDALLQHLQTATLKKLAVDNPRYSTFNSLTAGDQ